LKMRKGKRSESGHGSPWANSYPIKKRKRTFVEAVGSKEKRG